MFPCKFRIAYFNRTTPSHEWFWPFVGDLKGLMFNISSIKYKKIIRPMLFIFLSWAPTLFPTTFKARKICSFIHGNSIGSKQFPTRAVLWRANIFFIRPREKRLPRSKPYMIIYFLRTKMYSIIAERQHIDSLSLSLSNIITTGSN
jgi:hypothetical protein